MDVARRLPNELVLHIIESWSPAASDEREAHVERRRFFSACSLVAHSLRRPSQRALARSLYLTCRLEQVVYEFINFQPFLPDCVERLVVDLREELLPSKESDWARNLVTLCPRVRILGLMEVREVDFKQLAQLQRLERLHLHSLLWSSPGFRAVIPDAVRPPPFTALTCLSLVNQCLPLSPNTLTPLSLFLTPAVLPNLTALEIRDCCPRVVARSGLFHDTLHYFSLSTTNTHYAEEVELDRLLSSPLQLLDLSPLTLLLAFLQDTGASLPPATCVRVSHDQHELPHDIRPDKYTSILLTRLIAVLSSKDADASPFRDLERFEFPNVWPRRLNEHCQALLDVLQRLCDEVGVAYRFDSNRDGAKATKASRTACFSSGFWKAVDRTA
ncbi:hypothetical protein JCM5296_002739 [Sporobolomyces johnsonii]